jgi:hypothetical protein
MRDGRGNRDRAGRAEAAAETRSFLMIVRERDLFRQALETAR